MDKYCYSYNEENYHGKYDSREEALDAAIESDNEAKTIEIAKVIKIDPSFYFDLESLIETMNEQASDNEFGFVEDDIIDIDNFRELEKEIKELIDQYCSINYYTVGDIQKHKI